MPRPPRRVPSKKTGVSKTRISKPSAPASSSKGPRTSLPKKRVSTGRKRSVEAGEGSEREQQTEESAAVRAPKRRKSEGVGRTGSSHPILVARKRKVFLEDLESKWVQLSDSAISDLSQIMRDVGRSVLLEIPLKSAAKREEAQKTLEKSYQKFGRSLTRFKIPPGSSEKIFNNEYLINEEARLNALIEPETRQIKMLQAEITKQRKLLNQEEVDLHTLTKNANDNKRLHKDQARTFIPSLRKPNIDPDQLQLEIDKIRLDNNKLDPNEIAIAQDLEQDDEMGPTIHLLEKHLNSMARNRQALGVIPEWIQSTKAAVDEVVYRTKADRHGDLMDVSL